MKSYYILESGICLWEHRATQAGPYLTLSVFARDLGALLPVVNKLFESFAIYYQPWFRWRVTPNPKGGIVMQSRWRNDLASGRSGFHVGVVDVEPELAAIMSAAEQPFTILQLRSLSDCCHELLLGTGNEAVTCSSLLKHLSPLRVDVVAGTLGRILESGAVVALSRVFEDADTHAACQLIVPDKGDQSFQDRLSLLGCSRVSSREDVFQAISSMQQGGVAPDFR